MNNRWLAIGLAISLILNVFIVGALAGAVGQRMRMDRPHRPPMMPAGNPLMRAGAGLPEDVREAYFKRMREEGAASRPYMQEARAARAEAADVFAAPTFDKAAAAAALAKSRAAETAARERLEAAVVDFAAALPPEQRQELAQGLRQPPRPTGGRGGRRAGFEGGRDGFGGPGMRGDGPPPDADAPAGPPNGR